MFEIELFICIKMDLVLNNLQRLICHKTQTYKYNFYFTGLMIHSIIFLCQSHRQTPLLFIMHFLGVKISMYHQFVGFSLSVKPISFNLWLLERPYFVSWISCMQNICAPVSFREVNCFSYHHKHHQQILLFMILYH